MANNDNNLPNSLAAPQQPAEQPEEWLPDPVPLRRAPQQPVENNEENNEEKNRIYNEKVAKAKGGAKKTKKTKKTRKHRGIVQTGGNKGKLRKGYKYTGKKLKNGSAEIKKVKKNKK